MIWNQDSGEIIWLLRYLFCYFCKHASISYIITNYAKRIGEFTVHRNNMNFLILVIEFY